MPKTMTISKARQELTALPDQLTKEPQTIAITRRGQPVLALIPWEMYESIVETLEILGDEETVGALRKAIREIGDGQGVDWARAREQLRP
jgi:antitoxin YefM